MPRNDRNFFRGIVALVLVLNIAPFLIAARAGGEEFYFDGILLNPLDGHTYLAKMYQGFRGDWRFTLPYTSEPGQGAYLNMFYLVLGHAVRLTGIPLLTVFFIARILGGIFLLFTLHRFFLATIPESRPRRVAFALAALGSGMGWLLIPAGVFTADFWVAETYPFLSIYNSPHFSIGLALLLCLLTIPFDAEHDSKTLPRWFVVLLAAILGMISPFGVAIVLVVLSGWLAVVSVDELRRRAWRAILSRPQFLHLFLTAIGGVPILIYQFWTIRADPALSGWDAQNLTLTPPWWDVMVSLSPALLLGFFGWQKAKADSSTSVLGIWAVLGLILIAIPFGLQRRFLMGLYIPLAGLAALGLETLAGRKRSRVLLFMVVLFVLALPTNWIVILAGQEGVRLHDPVLYRTRAETVALNWLASQTPEDALILAAPETGLIIPAFSGRRVIYGHPFETVNAAAEEQTVSDFFQKMSESDAQALFADRGVDFVFFGPRERALGTPALLNDLELVFETGDVKIFSVEK